MKAVLIDDEKNALEMLEWQLQTYCPSVQVVATCRSAVDGIAAVEQYHPDIIFLDIEMPKQSGFEVLEHFNNPSFDVIFTTAYSQFALKAFRFAALDYLMKPIDAKELVAAVERCAKKQVGYQYRKQIDLLLQQIRQPDVLPDRVSFASQQAIHFIRPETIVFAESDSNYTTLHFTDHSKMIVSKTLKEVEVVLVHYKFLRIHHSFLINLNHVVRYIKADGGALELSGGKQLPISRQRRDAVMEMIAHL